MNEGIEKLRKELPLILTTSTIIKKLKELSQGHNILGVKEILKSIHLGHLKSYKKGSKYIFLRDDFITYFEKKYSYQPDCHFEEITQVNVADIDNRIKNAMGIK
jgi:hypothetical protein